MVLGGKETALILQSVEEYLRRLERDENKSFYDDQIKVAQSVFEKVLGLKLSDDGKRLTGLICKN